jgi:lysophospholipase L1-like esterase
LRYVAALLCLVAALVGCNRTPPAYESHYTPPPSTQPPAGKLVAVIGDSYTIQGPVPFPQLAVHNLARRGVPVTIGSIGGVSGTGYVNPGKGASQSTFGQRVPQFVTPDAAVVVFIGTRNDWQASYEDIASAARADYGAAKQIAPNAKLLVVGPIYPEPKMPEGVFVVRDAVRDQAQAAGAVFVDPLAEGWMTGDPSLLKADGQHPNEAGNKYLADKFAPILQSVLSNTS